MKRINNLYCSIYNPQNILLVYNEVTNNLNNKKKRLLLQEFKTNIIAYIYFTLKNNTYIPRKISYI